ncbi:kinase-like domain-containing protein [Hypoxylon sp. FL0890]|nr:kinase-like domain-containing protein [Hypoxylon sp. FL0890]
MSPHPSSLFSLRPRNSQAHSVLQNVEDGNLVSINSFYGPMIDIGHLPSKSSPTSPIVLATLGRSRGADIQISFDFISKLQCLFIVDHEAIQIILQDESTRGTTDFLDDNGNNLLSSPKRKIIVSRYQNGTIVMGKFPECVAFDLVWHRTDFEIPRWIRNRGKASQSQGLVSNSHHAREKPLSGGSIMHTKLAEIGSGSFGKIFRAVDEKGHIMAVKVCKTQKKENIKQLRNEVDVLSRLHHPHIINYIGSQGWEGGQEIEIFLGLKQGDLHSLLVKQPPKVLPDNDAFVSTLLKQMLQALDYLSTKHIVHRDIKPENILYEVKGHDNFTFQLADFGTYHDITKKARNAAGTRSYWAPEIGLEDPTEKADIWSLFIVLVWILDIDCFRRNVPSYKSRDERIALVYQAVKSGLKKYGHMCKISVDDRATAAQMLLKHYGGDGLSTDPSEIEPLTKKGEPCC